MIFAILTYDICYAAMLVFGAV